MNDYEEKTVSEGPWTIGDGGVTVVAFAARAVR
jgi:hypothetical protein